MAIIVRFYAYFKALRINADSREPTERQFRYYLKMKQIPSIDGVIETRRKFKNQIRQLWGLDDKLVNLDLSQEPAWDGPGVGAGGRAVITHARINQNLI